jgi:hypothetical protein
MADVTVTLEERVQILEVALLKIMLQDGFELRGSTVHEIKDSAKKAGLDPEKTVFVYEEILNKFIQKVFKK